MAILSILFKKKNDENRSHNLVGEGVFLQLFSEPSQNSRFFVQKFFSWRIFEIWRPKMAILSILFKKKIEVSISFVSP